MEGYHRPVLLREAIDALAIRDAWYLDTTIGDGGHTFEILKRGGKVVGLDVDPQALKRVEVRFEEAGIDNSRYRLLQGNFRDLKNLISLQTDLKDKKFDGVLFDLGVSSLQFEEAKRGFSFMKEGPLDMRMDPNLAVSATDLVSGLNKGELEKLFLTLGEEKLASKIAEELVRERIKKPITHTRELARLVEKVYHKRGRIHPATKVFQALRVAVNDELNALREALPQALEMLIPGGKILAISFHSLEDRILKNTFKAWQNEGKGQVVTPKPIIPSLAEIRGNPRSRSARFRIFVKS